MRHHIPRLDRMPGEDAEAEFADCRHLQGGEGAVAPVVPGIDDLDADAAVVQPAPPVPARHAGMPSALCFGYQTEDRAILLDDIMGGDPGVGIAQPG